MGNRSKYRYYLESQGASSDDLTTLDLKVTLSKLTEKHERLLVTRERLKTLLVLDEESQDKRIVELISFEDEYELVHVSHEEPGEQTTCENVAEHRLIVLLQIIVCNIVRLFAGKTQQDTYATYLKPPIDYEDLNSSGGVTIDAYLRGHYYSRSLWDLHDYFLKCEIKATIKAQERISRIIENKKGEARPKIRANYRVRNIRNDIRSILQFIFQPLEEPIYTF